VFIHFIFILKIGQINAISDKTMNTINNIKLDDKYSRGMTRRFLDNSKKNMAADQKSRRLKIGLSNLNMIPSHSPMYICARMTLAYVSTKNSMKK